MDPRFLPDYVLFNGKRTPGIASVNGLEDKRKWDERAGYGFVGATVVYHGWELSHFSVVLKLWLPEHWQEWEAFKPILAKPTKFKHTRGIDIVHPIIQEAGIKSVVVEAVGAPVKESDKGLWTIEIKLIQYNPPKFAVVQPDGSAATPEDPYEQRIAANSLTIDDLMQQFSKPLR